MSNTYSEYSTNDSHSPYSEFENLSEKLGKLISEHRRTWWSFFVFIIYFIYPFVSAFALTFVMLAVASRGIWEWSYLFLIVFFGSFAVWFGWWIKVRIAGYNYVAVYENGLLLRSHCNERMIEWANIKNIQCRDWFFLIQLIPIRWFTISIYTGNNGNEYIDEKFTIESGSGFSFSGLNRLLAELDARHLVESGK